MVLEFTKVRKKLKIFEAKTDYRYLQLKMISTPTHKMKWMKQIAVEN